MAVKEKDEALDAGHNEQDSGAEKKKESEQISTEVFEKLLKEKRAANKEAQDLKKSLDELTKKNKEYEDRDKSETEKASSRATEAEKKLAEVESKLMHQERLVVVLGAGIARQYADYIASELRNSEGRDDFQGMEKFFESIKKDKPAFFGDTKPPAPASAAGGGRQSGKGDRVAEIDEEIAAIEKAGRRTVQADQKLFGLRLERSRLQKQQAQK